MFGLQFDFGEEKANISSLVLLFFWADLLPELDFSARDVKQIDKYTSMDYRLYIYFLRLSLNI